MIALIMAVALNGGVPADAVLGLWRTETHNGVVDIQRCGETVCGRLIRSAGLEANPALTDLNNGNPKLRQRALQGLLIMSGFTLHENVWFGGSIYNAQDGRIYRATVAPVDPDHLKVRGCVFAPLCKMENWTRIR
jgi:uncharacterized protein (DUF2147 family)